MGHAMCIFACCLILYIIHNLTVYGRYIRAVITRGHRDICTHPRSSNVPRGQGQHFCRHNQKSVSIWIERAYYNIILYLEITSVILCLHSVSCQVCDNMDSIPRHYQNKVLQDNLSGKLEIENEGTGFVLVNYRHNYLRSK